MQPPSQAVLLSWSVPPAASFALTLTALIYLRGWMLLRRAGVPFLPPWRMVSFLLGLLSLWISLASPLDVFSGFVLTAHMLQHMMLMMVAPPLILLGAPLIPLVRGLPVFAAREFAGPFLNWRVARRVGSTLTHPLAALMLMGAVMFSWHTPRLYELALASGSWHEVEHACFFLTSLIFWWPVVQPWPSHPRWPRWAMVPYLLIADLQNTALSASLVFSDRVLYPTYSAVPRLFAFSATEDQAAAGAIMWVLGSLAFVVPAVVIAVQCLQSGPKREEQRRVPQWEVVSLDAMLAIPHRLSFVGSWCRRRIGTGRFEAVSFLVLFAAAGMSLAVLASAPSDDDDQAIRLSQQSGPFSVTVLGKPGNLEAGNSGFSVLVQDRNTQDVLADAQVELRGRLKGDTRETEAVRAASDDSENKLLQSADLRLPAEGDWTLTFAVSHNAEHADFFVPVHVTQVEQDFRMPWPYIVFFGFSAMLLLVYINRHRTQKTAGVRHSVTENAPGATTLTRPGH